VNNLPAGSRQTLAPIAMKYLIALPILILISCSGGAESNFVSEQTSREDSLRQVTMQFLNHPVFKDQDYQSKEFQKYEGLWNCLKIVRHRDNQVKFPKYSDLLFSEAKAWPLDYPCSWTHKSLSDDVFFRNDSIFFSHENRYFADGFRIEFSSDTLILAGFYETTYYLRKPYDSLILADLKEREFNEKCFTEKWELYQIDSGLSDTWSIKDGFLDHVPRQLDFSTNEFVVEGIYLTSTTNPNIKFEIIQFDRSFSEFDGESSFLNIKEMNEIDGNMYFYSYWPIVQRQQVLTAP
jgi:hypothetical protein